MPDSLPKEYMQYMQMKAQKLFILKNWKQIEHIC